MVLKILFAIKCFYKKKGKKPTNNADKITKLPRILLLITRKNTLGIIELLDS